MNQIDYQPAQPTSFNPALAFAAQAPIHSSGGQSFFPHSSAGPGSGPQAFPQAPYPGLSKQQPQQQLQQNGGGFAFSSSGLNSNVNVNGALTNHVSQQQQQQQQQQQLAGQQLPYSSSAPFSQSINATPGVTAAGGQGSLGAPHSASPFHASSPQAAFSPPGQTHMHQQSPMAPPHHQMQASPHTPARPQSQPHSPSSSPAAHAREKERIEVLLEINTELLREMQALQMQGKGGAATLEHAALMRKQQLDPKMGSEEFIQVMTRVHANLGYLCGASDHALKPGVKQAPHPPNYVYPPAAMPQLSDRYSKLRSLFPGWAGLDVQAGGQRSDFNNSTSTSPAAAGSLHG